MSEPIAPFLADGTYYVSLIMGIPAYSPNIKPHYSINVRPLTPDWDAVEATPPELMLITGERYPVLVIGTATLSPTPEAVKNGTWSGSDSHLLVDATTISPEIIQQARWYLRQRIGPLPSYNEPPA